MRFICSHNAYTICSRHPNNSNSYSLYGPNTFTSGTQTKSRNSTTSVSADMVRDELVVTNS